MAGISTVTTMGWAASDAALIFGQRRAAIANGFEQERTVEIKMMKRGQTWIGRMEFDRPPQPGQTIQLGDGNEYFVEKFVIDVEDGGVPFVTLAPEPIATSGGPDHTPRPI